MERLGKLLKQARLSKNLTLEEVSERTKIQCRYLEALERGDSTPFAAEVYFKGALRNFAEILNLDRQEVMRHYDRIRGEKAQPADDTGKLQETVDRVETADRARQIRRAKQISPDRSGMAPRFQSRKDPSFRVGLIILALLILAGIIYGILTGLPSQPPLPDPPTNEIQTGNREQLPGEVEVEPERVTVTRKDVTDGETTYIVTGPEQVEVTIHFHGRCWVQILVNGKETHKETNTSGGEVAVSGESVWIRLGYPPAAHIDVNGTEVTGLKKHNTPYNFNFVLQ